jgi:hypothetical protein
MLAARKRRKKLLPKFNPFPPFTRYTGMALRERTPTHGENHVLQDKTALVFAATLPMAHDTAS